MDLAYLRSRVLQALATISMIVVANFFLFRILPGDPERLLLGNTRTAASPEALAAQRAAWGLDKQLFPDQLLDYLRSLAVGDLGYSFKFRGESVVTVIGDRVLATILLIGAAQVLAIVIGVSIGAAAGWKRGRAADHIGTTVALVTYGTPAFWMGMIFITLFSVKLGWLPTNGMSTPGASDQGMWASVVDLARHMALPMTVLTLGLLGQYALVMRASLIEVKGEDYILTARAKGVTGGALLRRHAMPNARLPVVTLIALNMGFVIVGAVTVEAVFSWPGIGNLTVMSLQARDYPVLQGIFLLLSISIVGASLIADLAYALLDPRVSR